MEHITRQQTILIAILVAIVTSFATAITVVSLTDETGSPTQTIYRVIETTIEKVADISTSDTVTAPVKETPKNPSVIAPTDIAQIGAKSLVRIYDTTGGTRQFAALGVAVGTKDGLLASTLLVAHTDSSSYVAVLPDGSEVVAAFVKANVAGSYSYFTLSYAASVKSKVPTLDLKSMSALRLGSNVIAVGGKESGNVVSTGIVAELRTQEGESSTSTPSIIVTDMALTSNYSGFLLFDTAGNLVALEQGVDKAGGDHLFLNAAVIKTALGSLL